MAKIGIIFCFLLAITANCSKSTGADQARTQVQGERTEEQSEVNAAPEVLTPGRPAAFETDTYLPELSGKRLAFVVNHTSTIGEVHLIDSLQSLGLDLKKIFAPEHGFRSGAALLYLYLYPILRHGSRRGAGQRGDCA